MAFLDYLKNAAWQKFLEGKKAAREDFIQKINESLGIKNFGADAVNFPDDFRDKLEEYYIWLKNRKFSDNEYDAEDKMNVIGYLSYMERVMDIDDLSGGKKKIPKKNIAYEPILKDKFGNIFTHTYTFGYEKEMYNIKKLFKQAVTEYNINTRNTYFKMLEFYAKNKPFPGDDNYVDDVPSFKKKSNEEIKEYIEYLNTFNF